MEKRRWGKVGCERKNGNLIECPKKVESERIPDTSYKEHANCLSKTIYSQKTANYKLP